MKIDKKLKKRQATTLIELIIVLVMMGLFIMMVFNMFSVTYDGYLFNREMAARMYAQSNIDNFFEIFEKELMYSGSMDTIIKEDFISLKIDGGNDFLHIENTTNVATITTRYALAEKIILTNAFKDYYYQLVEDTSPNATLSETTYASKTFFALFQSDFPPYQPSPAKVKIWSLGYENMKTTPNATLFSITEYSTESFRRPTDGKTFRGTIIEEAKTINDTVIADDDLKIFISPLLYEKSFDSLNGKPIELSTNVEWYGEMIYKSKLYTQKQDNDKNTLFLDKTIPTINASYTIKLIDDITSFQATKLTNDLYSATVTYAFPLPGTTKEGTITVNRKFLKTQ